MRPKIKVSLKPVDVILEAVCISVFIALCVYLIFSWNKLPNIVPTHFGVSGKADGFGSRNSLLFLLPVILIFYPVLSLLQKFPYIYNYVVEITEKNAETQYIYAVRMIRMLKLELVLLFSYIEFQTIRAALPGENTLGVLFTPIVLVSLFGTLGFYIRKSIKSK